LLINQNIRFRADFRSFVLDAFINSFSFVFVLYGIIVALVGQNVGQNESVLRFETYIRQINT